MASVQSASLMTSVVAAATVAIISFSAGSDALLWTSLHPCPSTSTPSLLSPISHAPLSWRRGCSRKRRHFQPSRSSIIKGSSRISAKSSLLGSDNDDDSNGTNQRNKKGAQKRKSERAGKQKDKPRTIMNTKKKKKKKDLPKNQRKQSSTTARSKCKTAASSTNSAPSKLQPPDDDMYIQFSRVFQRHVIYKCSTSINDSSNTNPNGKLGNDEVIQSFEFLDEATKSFPNARVYAPRDLPFPPPSCSLVYSDETNQNGGNQLTISRGRLIDTEVEEKECDTTIAGMGLWTVCELEYNDDNASNSALADTEYRHEQANAALRTLLQLVSSQSSVDVPRHFFKLDPRRFAMRGLTPEAITLNHFKVVNLLTSGTANSVGLAMDPSDVAFVLQNFPHLCLYDCGELESLVRFLLQPLPPDGSFPSVAMVADKGVGGSNVDWPSLSGMGYGAGLTIDQATKAIRMMPELLAFYYEDSRKPSMVYLYGQLQLKLAVPPKLIDDSNVKLNLEGADPSEAYTFAGMHSIGISWGQLRILVASLPLWTTCNLEPGWELLQKGPVRSTLKRPALDYLRQRLQIGPGDVYRMLKTHTRLSTYDACKKILPTLDYLQYKLKLSSADLRKLMLRMPSLMGVGRSSFDDRLDFFTNEAGMSIKDLKVAVMRQPSLLQYGIDSSLRPKISFLVKELGISESSISRIVKLAPATMGLSLTDNLRPKVASIMKMCALDPHEVGSAITTSPQILLLSQRSKIEPTLNFIAPALHLREPRELGEFILKVPRILHHGIETSLAKKIEMLTTNNSQTSREVAIEIIHKNPGLMTASNAVLEDRIERCPPDQDIATWLSPSRQTKYIQQSATILKGDPILISPSPDDAFNFLLRIYSSVDDAAQKLGTTKSAIREACENGIPIDGHYLHSLIDSPLTRPAEPSQPKATSHKRTILVSIFCAGGIYPSDSADVARGQSRTGGLAIQVFTDGSIDDQSQFLREFSTASNSCFGIRVPLARKSDGSKLGAVFPLMNASRNRCELFSCSGALKTLEAFLEIKRSETDTLYDVKIYTESNYAWKLVKSKKLLLEIGSCFTSQEMLAHLGLTKHSVNIDILNPLARSFSRLNGGIEPPESTHKTFDNAKVEFIHAGTTVNNGGLRYAKNMNNQARSAAKWQFIRDQQRTLG